MSTLGSICSYYQNLDDKEFVSITDMAKKAKKNTTAWLRARQTISFITEWEKIHNPYFKEFDETEQLRNIKFSEFIKRTGAIGIIANKKSVMAHKDISMHFLMWAYPDLYLYIVKTMTTKVEITEISTNIF